MPLELNEAGQTFAIVLAFVLGAMVGSFLNVCVYRMPRNLSIVKPRSRCPKCERNIKWFDNIPIVSWLALGAKCRNCGEPISWQYPLVEAITGTLFVFVYVRFDLTIATPIYMALAASLVVVTFVDLTDWTIPNEITIPGVFAGIGCSLLAMVYPESGLLIDDPIQAIIGAVVGFAILYGMDKAALLLLGKRGMGFGDVKLMAMLGAFLGWQSVILILVVAAFLGSGVGLTVIWLKRGKRSDAEGMATGTYLPFGPYLAVGGVTALLVGADIIEAYTNYLTVPGPIS
jgi:leader peptidase (prepilin peptidase)/N-methyltransferase